MKHSQRWSGASISCRLEWRPSRWQMFALSSITLLAGFSLVASELPALAAWPLAVLVMGYGSWQVRREQRKPALELFFPGNDLPVMVEGTAVDAMQVEWRGPLAFACWRGGDGRMQRLSWWPDTLPPARRRELRLAAGGMQAARKTRAMAP